MRLTSPRSLALAFGLGAGFGVIVCAVLLRGGRAPYDVPASLYAPVLAMAFFALVNGWRVRRLRKGRRSRIGPLQAVRVAVLAQACSRSGAFLAGLSGASAALFWRTGQTGYVRAQVLSLVLAGGASLVLAIAGWVAERWCVVDADDEDDPPDGFQASGAST